MKSYHYEYTFAYTQDGEEREVTHDVLLTHHPHTIQLSRQQIDHEIAFRLQAWPKEQNAHVTKIVEYVIERNEIPI